jgi:hypothetical protein
MSLTIGRLAAQVLCVREMPATNISTLSRYYFAPAEVLIWPDDSEARMTWPPGQVLAPDLFSKWHLRWNSEESAARHAPLSDI